MAKFNPKSAALWCLGMASTAAASMRHIQYFTGQHPVAPDLSLSKSITHIAMAFMNSDTFNRDEGQHDWDLFMTVDEARGLFHNGTKVMVAIGGWGDTDGFDKGARTDASRKKWASNVAAMVKDTGADGVDIDWEYPGGNGEDYKETPNSEKRWEIDAYPLFLAEIRAALGPDKLISAAVPGMTRDMLAFHKDTVPAIMSSIDWLNVMTYDMMNRRDNVTKHHSGRTLSLTAIDAYHSFGCPYEDMNLGFGFYTKFFRTQHQPCLDAPTPVGCPTVLMEDPETGADLGKTGGFSWHDEIPEDIAPSFARAQKHGLIDPEDGCGYYYWDSQEDIWWTYDTVDSLAAKFPKIVEDRPGLGGVFAWGLGEDATEFKHLEAVNKGLAGLKKEAGGPKKVVSGGMKKKGVAGKVEL